MITLPQNMRGLRFNRLPLSGKLPSKKFLIDETKNLFLMLAGIITGVFSYILFQVPFDITWGGTTGVAQIINHFTGISHGLTYWVLSIPLATLGYFYLGGWRFLYKSMLVSTIYAILTDSLLAVLPTIMTWPVTDSKMLAVFYGAVLGGISGGLIYKSGTSYPGTSVISRIINQKTGLPLSIIYLFVDGGVIAATGFIFGLENALFGMLMLGVGGTITDYVLDGPSTTSTITVVTNHPKAVADALMAKLNKGVSYWEITGAYTNETRFMLMTTIYRTQMHDVKTAVAEVDEKAFVSIGAGQKAMGEGFQPLAGKKGWRSPK